MRGPVRSDNRGDVGADPNRPCSLSSHTEPGHTGWLQEFLVPFWGLMILGGCEACDAVQEVSPSAHIHDVWFVTVYHEDDCPLQAMREAGL